MKAAVTVGQQPHTQRCSQLPLLQHDQARAVAVSVSATGSPGDSCSLKKVVRAASRQQTTICRAEAAPRESSPARP